MTISTYYACKQFWIPPTWDKNTLSLSIYVKKYSTYTPVSFRAIIDTYLNTSTTAALQTKFVTWSAQDLSGNARVTLNSDLLALGVFGAAGVSFDSTNGGYVSVGVCTTAGSYASLLEEMRLVYSTSKIACITSIT